MKYKIKSFSVLIITLFTIGIYAQEQQVSSLLSNYGLGSVFSEATVVERAQGGLAVVNNNTDNVISITNPALLANLNLTSFSLEIQTNSLNVQTQDAKLINSSLSLSNVSLGIPIGSKGGFSVGLRAKSAVGFEIDSGDFYNVGSGGVNQFYLGFGYEVYKGLSLGGQYSEYFGRTNKTKAFKSSQVPTVQDINYNVKAKSFKLGIQYKYAFTEKIEVSVGAYGELEHDISASGESRFYEAKQISLNNFEETASSVINEEAKIITLNGLEKNPLKSVIGLGVGKKNNWFAGLSYESKDAIEYSGNVFRETVQPEFDINGSTLKVDYETSNKISLGGYIIPEKYALRNYFKRMIYRAGFQYQKTGLVLNNKSVKDLGMSFGLGLPVGKRVSYLDIFLELGRRGEFSKNKYQEEYLNLGVSFSLSDKWFKKRVIN